MTTKALGSTDLKRLHRQWRRRTERRVSLLLEDVAGTFNVGSIVRSAAAYRIEHLWVVGSTALPDDRKVGRTALGSERFVPWSHHENAADAAADIEKRGFKLVGVELTREATPIHDFDLTSPVCLALGNEDRGLSSDLLSLCADVVFLPQLGRIGSLNVATAASIAMYETRRQHFETGS